MVLYADIRPAPIGTFSCASKRDTALVTNVVFRDIELHVLQLNLIYLKFGELYCAFELKFEMTLTW